MTDALNQDTTYGYDELGQQISQTDANNQPTTFEYDSMGRRIGRTLPLGQTESFQYDLAGNLTDKTDFNGKVTTFAYDSLNRLMTKTPDPSFGAPGVSFTYTASGQRASMTDASGLTTYTYDNRDRLTDKDSLRGALTYTYNLTGNLASIRSSHIDGVSIDYSYDTLNRLATVTDNNLANGVTDYHYDLVGNLAGYDYPNGTSTAYTYNNLNRLTDMSVDQAGTVLARYTYTLGQTGNRLSVAELGGRSVAYAYDALYRLKQEAITGGTSNGQVDYIYDKAGNRLSRTSTLAPIANQTFTYDENDRLNTDTYDANGNTTGSSGKTYAYDFENHLSSQNGTQVGIVYDGDGNRAAETAGGVTTEYLVDTLNPTGYAQVLEEIVNGQVATRYTYGSDLISQSRKAGSIWNTHFYGYDGHGSVRFLMDGNGQVTDRYDYEAFGNLIGVTGGTANSYLYSGEQRDFGLGLDYLRARYYSHEQGRFRTRDSVAGQSFDPPSLRASNYTKVNPVNWLDPSGNFTLSELTASSEYNLFFVFKSPSKPYLR
ncbi:MAG: RHS repeat-associated core domain-containing protein [Methylococcales bacterium]